MKTWNRQFIRLSWPLLCSSWRALSSENGRLRWRDEGQLAEGPGGTFATWWRSWSSSRYASGLTWRWCDRCFRLACSENVETKKALKMNSPHVSQERMSGCTQSGVVDTWSSLVFRNVLHHKKTCWRIHRRSNDKYLQPSSPSCRQRWRPSYRPRERCRSTLCAPIHCSGMSWCSSSCWAPTKNNLWCREYQLTL